MAIVEARRKERRAREQKLSRAAILESARRVAVRDGARELSLRAVAAEAGFAPAALYGYFRNKDELLLALAADDLAALVRAARGHAAPFPDALAAMLEALSGSESLAAAVAALTSGDAGGEAERVFNGRLIAALKHISDSAGLNAATREGQLDAVLVAAALSGLAVLARAGRLAALGLPERELLGRLAARLSP